MNVTHSSLNPSTGKKFKKLRGGVKLKAIRPRRVSQALAVEYFCVIEAGIAASFRGVDFPRV